MIDDLIVELDLTEEDLLKIKDRMHKDREYKEKFLSGEVTYEEYFEKHAREYQFKIKV